MALAKPEIEQTDEASRAIDRNELLVAISAARQGGYFETEKAHIEMLRLMDQYNQSY